MKKLGLLLVIMSLGLPGVAQKNHLSSRQGVGSLGIGLGLPYGAAGLRLGINPIQGVRLFAGVGYQIVGVGYNLGIQKEFQSVEMLQFYFSAMYGTNAAIKVIGFPGFNKLYTGGSIGFGFKINSRGMEGSFWDIGLLVPMRSSEFSNDVEELRMNPRITEPSEPWPVLIVIGFNFKL